MNDPEHPKETHETNEHHASDGDESTAPSGSAPSDLPKIRALSPAMEVPVFNLIVYITTTSNGMQARVVNLPDLVFTGTSEPSVLKQLVTEAKSRLATWHSTAQTIPWIDPVPPPSPSDQQRFIPLHL